MTTPRLDTSVRWSRPISGGDLLWTHVGVGPAKSPVWEQRLVRDPGEAEVGDFGLVARRDEDVLGLEVPVDHAAGVGCLQGVRDPREERGDVPVVALQDLLAAAGLVEELAEGPGAVDVLHGDPGDAAVLAVGEDPHDPGWATRPLARASRAKNSRARSETRSGRMTLSATSRLRRVFRASHT